MESIRPIGIVANPIGMAKHRQIMHGLRQMDGVRFIAGHFADVGKKIGLQFKQNACLLVRVHQHTIDV